MKTTMFPKAPAVRAVLIVLGAAHLQAQQPNQRLDEHARLAQQYLAQHRPELAIPELEKVVATEPKNVQAQANLGVLLYFSNRMADAEPHLRAGLALDPTQSKLQMLLGSCEHRSGRLAEARKDLGAAFASLQDAKVRKQAGLEIIEVDTALTDLPAATSVVNALKATYPADPEVLYAAYRVFTDLANESMLDLSFVAPDSAQFHQAMAHELYRYQDNNGAITNMRQAVDLNPMLPGGHYELGQLLSASPQQNVKAQAEKEYTLAVAQSPSDPAALTRLGDLLGDKGDHAGAIARYKQALAAQPEFPDASIGLAYQLTETGHADEALPLLQAAIKADPTNVLAHYRLSAVYRRLHRMNDAKREVAEYERLKAIKEKLRTVYDSARLNTAQSGEAKQ